MARFGEGFIGQYSVTKTLRFGLVPIGKTKEYINDDFLEKDVARNEQYPVIKEMLDKYYQYYIEQSLKNQKLDEKILDDAYQAFCSGNEKGIEKINEKLRKSVAAMFNNRKDYLLDKYDKLLVLADKKGKNSLLYEWMLASFDKEIIEKYKVAVKGFDKFTTYFVGYKETRENMFTSDEKASAISFRIVNQNMYRYFANTRQYEIICRKYPDLAQKLKKFDKWFQPAGFANILSQSQIDNYNYEVIGGNTDENDGKGVNSLINEYRQKNNLKNRELPVMQVLYKQILGESEKRFIIEEINSSEEAIEMACSIYNEAVPVLEEIKVLVKDNITVDNLQNIYIKQQSLADISQKMFGQWDILRNAVADDFDENKTINLQILQEKTEKYINVLDEEEKGKYRDKNNFVDYFNNPPEFVEKLKTGKENIREYKEELDGMLDAIRFWKTLYLYNGKKALPIPENSLMFYTEFNQLYEKLKEFTYQYDRIRNFATKKPYSVEKMKLNFDLPTLLAGWDLNKEEANASFLFKRDNKYYLGIANTQNKKIFSLKNKEMKQAMQQTSDCYEKIQYKQISGANKMLPKVFLAKSPVAEFPVTKRIMEISERKLYTKEAGDVKALHEWIDFCKDSIAIHPEWSQYFDFQFKPTKEYTNIKDFYQEIDRQAYSFEFVPVAADYIDKLVEEGKLYLFQIYNKDFAPYAHGRENLHTMYWKYLFSQENLTALAAKNVPAVKLNGEAEIFMREASIERKITHPKNQPIGNKNPLTEKKTSTFNYDLIKDKRFTERKYFFHCPITLNFRDADAKFGYNEKVNRFVENNPDINIIGIDRGERHLLYYTVINQQGDILEQGSLNKIDSDYKDRNGKLTPKITDYHELLDEREKDRQQARQAWDVIENIKELKAGYLSQVVHKLTELMIKHNAVVVLEDLNSKFKRSRIKVEKQVYQKFEKALIEKLNYLVFKDRDFKEIGSFAKGYQLAAPFESFEKLRKQTGCIYYINPSYTSHVDPKTGFVNLLKPYLHYESVAKTRDFLSRWISVKWNPVQKYFEFELDYKKFNREMAKTEWTICTHGEERWDYTPRSNKAEKYCVTKELQKLFADHAVEYADGKDILKDKILRQDKPDFWRRLLYLLRLTMQLRYTVSGTKDDDDYILSPIEYEKGKFFDSRQAKETEPKNADANGAYHIALKGLQTISTIVDGKLSSKLDTVEYFKYVQDKPFRE